MRRAISAIRPAEEPALGDDHLVAELEQVHDPGLHAGRAGAVEREHEPVGHAVDAPQHVHDLEQDLVEVGVQVAEHRPPHGVEYGGVYVRRPGAAEEPLRRPEAREIHLLRVPHRYREHKLRVLRNT